MLEDQDIDDDPDAEASDAGTRFIPTDSSDDDGLIGLDTEDGVEGSHERRTLEQKFDCTQPFAGGRTVGDALQFCRGILSGLSRNAQDAMYSWLADISASPFPTSAYLTAKCVLGAGARIHTTTSGEGNCYSVSLIERLRSLLAMDEFTAALKLGTEKARAGEDLFACAAYQREHVQQCLQHEIPFILTGMNRSPSLPHRSHTRPHFAAHTRWPRVPKLTP